jgi:hypothetical protein
LHSDLITVRTLLDDFIPILDSKQIQIEVLVDSLDWAKREKGIFLKHRGSLAVIVPFF